MRYPQRRRCLERRALCPPLASYGLGFKGNGKGLDVLTPFCTISKVYLIVRR